MFYNICNLALGIIFHFIQSIIVILITGIGIFNNSEITFIIKLWQCPIIFVLHLEAFLKTLLKEKDDGEFGSEDVSTARNITSESTSVYLNGSSTSMDKEVEYASNYSTGISSTPRTSATDYYDYYPNHTMKLIIDMHSLLFVTIFKIA